MNPTHPLVGAYLDRLETLLQGAGAATRSEVVAGVREHLAARLPAGADDATVRGALAELGTPEQIADEAYAAGPPRDSRAQPSRARTWLPVAVMVLATLTTLAMLFVAVGGPHPAEVALVLMMPPAWPVLTILVLAFSAWTGREKAVLVAAFPVVSLIAGMAARLSPGSANGIPLAGAVLGLGSVAALVTVAALARRALRRSP